MVISHTFGDAACLETLRGIMTRNAGNQFEAAIVMGTTAAALLPPASRDMRVLSTMLLLRQAHAELFTSGEPLHVVGENCFDATAPLALAPNSTHRPDFVNTQAIYARALTQALAYPIMQPAIAQLFSPSSTGQPSPELQMVPAGRELVPLGPATFSQLTRAVMARWNGAICLGYTHRGEAVLGPPPSSSHHFVDGDMIVVIRREEEAERMRRTSMFQKQTLPS